MAEEMNWDDRLATGNETLDDQHRRIIDLAAEISSDLRQEDIKLRILELYRHTREHFEHEEHLMETVNFPGRGDHRQEHSEMLEGLNRLVVSLEGNSTDCEKLRAFVDKWVSEHVCRRDRELVDYLRP